MPDKGLTKSTDPKVRFVVEKYADSKDYYRGLRKRFGAWDDMYFSIPNPKKWDWMSNIFVPKTHETVMTLLSRVVNNTTAVDPYFDTVPSNKALSNLIRSQLFKSGFYENYVSFALQLLIRGTSIGKVTWQKRTKTIFSLEKVMENYMKEIVNDMGATEEIPQQRFKGYKKKPKEAIKYDGPVFETIDLYDFFPEPKASNLLDGTRVFRSVKTVDEVKRNPNYINKDQLKATKFPEPEVFPHSRLKHQGLQPPMFKPSDQMPTDEAKRSTDFVEILECETKWWNPKTKRLDNWLLVIGNNEVLLRDEAFPYWNCETLYVKGVWIPVLNEFYGMGIPELTESLQEELNDKRNQRLDNVNQVLMPIFMYEEGAIDPKYFRTWERKPGAKLRTRPGGVSGRAVQWDICPDVTGTAMMECQNLESDIEEVTGAVKAIQPSSGSGDQIHRTSSGLMMLQSMAHEKIKLNLSIIEKQVLEPVFEKFNDLNLQLLTPGYKIFNPEGKQSIYQPEMIAGDHEFRAKGSKYALDQQMKLMNTSRIIEALGASGLPLGELHVKFWMRLYDAMGFEDKDEVEELLRAEIAKFMQMQQQMAMMKAGGGEGGGGAPPDLGREMTGDAMGADATRAGVGEMIPGGGI